jgi:hypothetical protein
MQTDRNNFIRYASPTITTIGGVNNLLGAVGILARYDFIVVEPPQVEQDAADLAEVIRAVKVINENAKFFGYTALGGAANLDQWKVQADNWVNTLPVQGVLDGFFIDEFGFSDGVGTATRDNQNAAVTYTYAQFASSTPLQVMVSATEPMDALESYDSLADPVIGTGSGQDVILLDGFYFAGSTPTAEPKEAMYGRLEYAISKTKPAPPAPNAITLPKPKILVVLGVSAGAGTTNIPAVDYAKVLNLAEVYPVAGLGVYPTDSATSHQYYYQDTANDFDQ